MNSRRLKELYAMSGFDVSVEKGGSKECRFYRVVWTGAPKGYEWSDYLPYYGTWQHYPNSIHRFRSLRCRDRWERFFEFWWFEISNPAMLKLCTLTMRLTGWRKIKGWNFTPTEKQ